MRPTDLAACVDAFAREIGFVCEVLPRYGVPDSDVDDLVQEVFLVLWRRWDAYDQDRPLRPWLRGIAARVALKHLSREHARREVLGGIIDRPDEAPTVEELIDADSRRALLLGVLASLPEKQRNVILLHEVEGMPMREVADALEVPLKTAHSRLRTGRIELDRRLRQLRAVSSDDAAGLDLSLLRQALVLPPDAPGASSERQRRALGRVRALAALPSFRRTRSVSLGPPLRQALLAATLAACAALVISQRSPDERAEPAAGAARAVAPVAATGARRWNVRLPASVLPLIPALGTMDEAPPASTSPAEIPGLAAHFSFDRPSGERIADEDLAAAAGCTIRGRKRGGVEWTQGRHTGGVDLGGFGWLECPSEAVARLGGALTVAAWIKRTGEREHVRSLVTWHYGDGSLDYFQFGFRHEQLFVRTRLEHPGVLAPAGPARGSWAHVALALSADGTAQFFLDGARIHTAFVGHRSRLGSGSHPMLIGALGNRLNPARSHEVVEAVVDEVALYDRALADEEIAALAFR